MEESISVIVPITERHDDIGEMYRAYRDALARTNKPFEMIFVVDGDFRKAYLQLKALKEQGERMTLIKHSMAFGESAAIVSGFRQATGAVILTLPAYHQVEPAELPRLIPALDGCDMVVARRWPRYDSRLNQFQTKLFHDLVRGISKNRFHDIGCGVRLFRRKILEEISLYGDLHRFLPVLSDRQGFKVREVDLPQFSGEKRVRTYSAGVYLRRMIDLLTVFFLIKFTKKPLRFFGLTGSAVLLAGFLISAYLVVARLIFDIPLSDRPLFLIGILFVVLGLQIFAIGLVGEILIFTHAKDIRDYQVDEIIN
jgi:glycosyltransferase involved in cell wall biosynthesis